jgi:hypothetical protein
MGASKIIIALVIISCGLFTALVAVPASVGLYYMKEMYGPSQAFQHQDEKDLLRKDCYTTTRKLEDLVLHEHFTREQGDTITTQHGAAVIPNVLTREVAQELRDHVIQANRHAQQRKEHQTPVPGEEHRYSLNLQVGDPSVQKALKQIGEHHKLRPLIEDLTGSSPTLVGLNVVITEYGANDQAVHCDAWMHLPSYPDYFVKEYTVAVALQNTTENMGATRLCPGTQHCENVVRSRWRQEHLTCKVQANISQGDAFIYASDLHHGETSHTNPDGEARAFIFLTFAESRRDKDDNRKLPLGNVRAVDWQMWGHTIDEFETVTQWRWWHSLGLFNHRKSDVRPWNAIDNLFVIFQSDDEIVHMVNNGFSKKEFDKFAKKAIHYVFLGVCAYISATSLCVATAIICFGICSSSAKK